MKMPERKLSEISNLQRETKVESEIWTCVASSKDSFFPRQDSGAVVNTVLWVL